MLKTRVKMGLFAVLFLLSALCFGTMARADEPASITITLSFDKSPINVGETVQASYSVTGGSGSYKKIEYRWDLYVDDSWTAGTPAALSETTGTIAFTPNAAGKYRLYLTASDTAGKTQSAWKSLQVQIPTEPISITIEWDKTPLYAGETAQASYTITGGTGVYTDIQYHWDIFNAEGSWVSGEPVTASESSGSLSYLPEGGTKVRLSISVTDSQGRMKTSASGIPVYAREILVSDYPSSIVAGERFTLNAGINDGTEDTFSFESSDPAVITVDSKGSVLGISKGTARVIISGNETGLRKEVEITVTTSEPAELTATLGTPSYSTSGSGSSLTYTLTFPASVSGGVSPYTYSYKLYRDNKEIYAGEDLGPAFTVTGTTLGVEGIYTARAVVEDSRGTKTTVWSSGCFEKGSASDSVREIHMDTPDFTLPADIKTLEADSFENTSAAAVYIPDGCTSIGSGTFSDCGRLTQIRIPQDCEVADDAFSGCPYVTIFGVKGSPAEDFAIRHEEQFRFLPE